MTTDMLYPFQSIAQKSPFATITIPILSVCGYLFKQMLDAVDREDTRAVAAWYLGLTGFYITSIALVHPYFQRLDRLAAIAKQSFAGA